MFRPFLAVIVSIMLVTPAFADTARLSDLDLSKMSAGWGKPVANRSVQEKTLRIGGREFAHGVGSHAASVIYITLAGAAEKFTGLVGVDDEVKGNIGSVRFRIMGDGKLLWDSGVRKAGQEAVPFDVDLRGIQSLILCADPAEDGVSYDHADWAEAQFTYSGSAPVAADAPREEPYILTPPSPPEPRVNGPKVFGVRPGSPFFYTIPATGDRPMTFAADGLPEGLTLDADRGRIEGVLKDRGEYAVTLHAKNALGASSRPFKIVVGDKLALTPPMGWNSWYCFFDSVTDTMMRSAADAIVSTGMINHGWMYVNIDDGWSVKPNADNPEQGGVARDAGGAINGNGKFPDMRAMTDYIHGLGLRAGLYTSPGPLTCAGYEGSYQHEREDAQRFAEWGFDFLKHDWCSYTKHMGKPSLNGLKAPYILMKRCLDAQPRDIVYNLCQYGMGRVWEWGAEVGGNCWRTTGDLGVASDLFTNIRNYGAFHNDKAQWNTPGGYNDPDYLLIGYIGWQGQLRPTPLTPNEQYFHVTLWALLAAPLIFSGDVMQIDPFTLSLLTNDEVIEVDQDPLCRAATRVAQQDACEVWAKEMEDGSKAVGLLNLDEIEQTVTVRWQNLGFAGPCRVRDLWRQQDLGEFKDAFEMPVPRHGAAMIRVFRP